MNRFRQFMMGRRGMDELGRFLSILVVILAIADMFIRTQICYYIAILLMFYEIFRMLSRNISARYRENQKFLQLKMRFVKPKRKGSSQRNTYQTADYRGYRFFTCPGCRQKMRAPEGKGRIRVTCNKCGKKFETIV